MPGKINTTSQDFFDYLKKYVKNTTGKIFNLEDTMRIIFSILIIISCYESYAFFNENNNCDIAEKQCAQNVGEDNYDLYGQCLQDVAEDLNAFLYDYGLICEGETNYCSVAKDTCRELVSDGDYYSINECLKLRASKSCI